MSEPLQFNNDGTVGEPRMKDVIRRLNLDSMEVIRDQMVPPGTLMIMNGREFDILRRAALKFELPPPPPLNSSGFEFRMYRPQVQIPRALVAYETVCGPTSKPCSNKLLPLVVLAVVVVLFAVAWALDR